MSLTSNHFLPHRDAPEPYIEPKPAVFIHERPRGVNVSEIRSGIFEVDEPERRCPLVAWVITFTVGWALLTAYWWVPALLERVNGR